jgi:hypothetical protein
MVIWVVMSCNSETAQRFREKTTVPPSSASESRPNMKLEEAWSYCLLLLLVSHQFTSQLWRQRLCAAPKCWVLSKLHSTTSHKTVFSIGAMRTSNPTELIRKWESAVFDFVVGICSVWFFVGICSVWFFCGNLQGLIFLAVIYNLHRSQLTKIYDIKYFKWFVTGDWAQESSIWVGC